MAVLKYMLCLNIAFAGVIISDFDNTFKRTNDANLATMSSNVFKKDNAFSGMELVYQELQKDNELYFVSASPSALKYWIEDFLDFYEISYQRLFLRKTKHLINKFKYKVETIASIIKATSGDVTLLGDDLGSDEKIYDKLKEMFPDRIKSIFIHKMKKDSKRSDFYITALDLASSMKLGNTKEIREAVLDANEYDLIPNFAFCPILPWGSRFYDLEYQYKIIKTCGKR